MGLLGPADTCRFGSSAATVVAVAEPAGLEEVAPAVTASRRAASVTWLMGSRTW